MKNFPEGITFKYPWRKYQQHFLDGLEDNLSDHHLHVVAPPGSGKTVLGLEIMLRLDEPTLIVAPTLAIRDQWISRFYELFLQTDQKVDWISKDFKNPKKITVTTYQGIHAACNHQKEANNDEEVTADDFQTPYNAKAIKEVLQQLKKQKVKTFILDEAHHLKNAWWSSLMELKNGISPTIVALTATPPFEVSGLEWQKYIQLNGEVDVEISVPELMLEGDLCPHQDFVYFTLPTEQEQKTVEDHYQRAEKMILEISNDSALLNAILSHPIYQNPQKNLDWIYDNISSYSSGLIYLKYKGIEIPKIHFEILDDDQNLVPEITIFWWVELLDFYLFVDTLHFQNFEEHRTNLENRLRHNGFIENKFVNFYNTKNLNQIFNQSLGKLDAINKISEFEFSTLGEDLRMLILTDFIRKEFLVSEKTNELVIDKIGAIPIFENLRRQNSQQRRIGVLTGSIVILPKVSLSQFLVICERKNIEKIQYSTLAFDENYILIQQNESIKYDIVQMITEIFESGGIHILIGTKSLLGEGWDAPKINSLVLASFISSFVLSNQMRGRAIRVDKSNPNKASNVWHLVCLDPNHSEGGSDYIKIKKRFKTFVGISNTNDPVIENKYDRLGFKEIVTTNQISEMNNQTMVLAKNRKDILNRWKIALSKGKILIEEIQIPFNEEKDFKTMKSNFLGKTLGNLSLTLFSTFFMFWGNFASTIIKSWNRINDLRSFTIFTTLLGIAGFLTFGGKFYRAFRQYLKYKNIAKYVQKYGEVVLKTAINERLINTPYQKLQIISENDDNGNSVCYLSGGNRYENNQFINLLKETLSPIDNPRYLIKENKSFFGRDKTMYFAIPEIFAKNKRSAEFFCKIWNNEVSNCQLIYTRTIEGRQILLKERFKTLMNKHKHIEHLNKWTR